MNRSRLDRAIRFKGLITAGTLIVLLLPAIAMAQSRVTVTNSGDSGPGTLRDAINLGLSHILLAIKPDLDFAVVGPDIRYSRSFPGSRNPHNWTVNGAVQSRSGFTAINKCESPISEARGGSLIDIVQLSDGFLQML